MNTQTKRLLQALEQFQERTKGAKDLSPDVGKAIEALQGALNAPPVSEDSPGRLSALDAVKGTTGAGEPMEKAAKGPDGPSPGQTEGRSMSEQIHEAAQAIAASAKKN